MQVHFTLHLLLVICFFKCRTHSSTSPLPLNFPDIRNQIKSDLVLHNVECRWSSVQWSCLFIINIIVSAKKIFTIIIYKHKAEQTQREQECIPRNCFSSNCNFLSRMNASFNDRVMVETSLSSSTQRLNVSPGQKPSSLLLLITSSDCSDEDFIQRRAYGFWQVWDGGVIGARGPRKQLLWNRLGRVFDYFLYRWPEIWS